MMRRKTRVIAVLVAMGMAGDSAAVSRSSRAAAASTQAQAPAPAHLTIVSASINELPPISWRDVGGRKVRLRLQLAGSPPCATGRLLSYGFLVDSDLNPQTGQAGLERADLGIDARVTIQCDPATRRFKSPQGVVTQSEVGGRATLDLVTTVRRLPSVDFQWIAYAAEGDAWTRLPQSPGHGTWAIHERTIF